MENSRNIEIIHKNLSSCVESLKMTIKHYHMMHNQVEQMIYLQNKLYEKLLDEKRQVCGVNKRGSSTQDPDYPEGHPKRKEQEARKKKSFARESPNESEENENSGD